MPFRLSLLVCSLLCALPHPAAAEPVPLKLDRTFKQLPPSDEPGVAFISAQRMEARQGDQLEASGAVELRHEGKVVKADHLLYEQEKRDVYADGNVSIVQGQTQVAGPSLNLNLDRDVGQMAQPEFLLGENNARGNARVMDLDGRTRYTFRSAAYTTCPAGNDDWLVRMSTLEIDRDKQVGVAYNARLEFKGVPFLYTPWMDFALNDDKRSGFLGPTFGSTSSGGSEFMLPYFWNIAPNYDATFSPRMISKRGTQYNNEFRYLRPAYSGEIEADVLSDRLAGQSRSHYALRHRHALGSGFSASLDVNAVSDDAYYRDLATSVRGTSQINLLREGVVSYAGYGWNAAARVRRYQTLQDPLAPVGIPYRQQPQLTLSTNQPMEEGTLAFSSEYVDYRHPTAVNGRRMVLYPSLSYPLLNEPGYFLTPKLGLHYTSYALGDNNTANLPDATRSVPIFSLDSGLIFERNDSFLGNAYMQTLEPRAYYVRIPYRDQSQMPNFDTALAPFSLSQIFTENRFLGSDRVGDADMMTLGVTSRVIDGDDGTERLRVAVAERFTFQVPQVTLGSPADSNSRSDILLGLGGRMSRAWNMDGLLQYNPNLGYTQSYYATARYNPESGKLLNLGYRFTRDSLRQMDISAQWPLFGRWHGVGRFNYSVRDDRLLEALGGLEYNADCWTVRLVVQSFATSTNLRNTGFFTQLELGDLVRIGSDPLEALRISIPGYTKLNTAPAAQPEQGLR